MICTTAWKHRKIALVFGLWTVMKWWLYCHCCKQTKQKTKPRQKGSKLLGVCALMVILQNKTFTHVSCDCLLGLTCCSHSYYSRKKDQRILWTNTIKISEEFTAPVTDHILIWRMRYNFILGFAHADIPEIWSIWDKHFRNCPVSFMY